MDIDVLIALLKELFAAGSPGLALIIGLAFLVQMVKKWFNLENEKAYLLAGTLSIALSAFYLFVTGQIDLGTGPWYLAAIQVFKLAFMALGGAYMIFRLIIQKLDGSEAPPWFPKAMDLLLVILRWLGIEVDPPGTARRFGEQ